MNITKREYINSLEYDLNYFRTEAVKKQIGFWHLGDFIPKYKARIRILEMVDELTAIQNDKNYKPWKSSN